MLQTLMNYLLKWINTFFFHKQLISQTMKIFKRILLAIACVCLLLACTKPNNELGAPTTQTQNPQLKSADTKSDVIYGEIGWIIDVNCDGAWVDEITGDANAHAVAHYKDGVLKWTILSYKGTGTSVISGETFTISEQDKVEYTTLPYIYTAHTNVKGDKGTLYNFCFIFKYDINGNMVAWQLKNATCTGNTK
jgi:hypothetical protein